jgi:hypothetical protein
LCLQGTDSDCVGDAKVEEDKGRKGVMKYFDSNPQLVRGQRKEHDYGGAARCRSSQRYSDVPGSERPDPSLRPLRWKQTFGMLSKEGSSYKKGSCQLQKRPECQVEMNVPKFQKARLADGNGEYQRRVVLICQR